MKKFTLYLSTLLMTLILTSCGDSDIKSTTSLNTEQQDALAQILLRASIFPTEDYLPVSLQDPVDETISCPVSGSFSAKGNVDYEQDQQNQTFDGTFTLNKVVFTDCVINTTTDEEITFNGTLEIETRLSLDSFNDGEGGGILTGEFDSSYTGSLEVSGDEVENGSCGINMKSDTLLAEFFLLGTFTGNLCGTNYDKVVPFLFD